MEKGTPVLLVKGLRISPSRAGDAHGAGEVPAGENSRLVPLARLSMLGAMRSRQRSVFQSSMRSRTPTTITGLSVARPAHSRQALGTVIRHCVSMSTLEEWAASRASHLPVLRVEVLHLHHRLQPAVELCGRPERQALLLVVGDDGGVLLPFEAVAKRCRDDDSSLAVKGVLKTPVQRLHCRLPLSKNRVDIAPVLHLHPLYSPQPPRTRALRPEFGQKKARQAQNSLSVARENCWPIRSVAQPASGATDRLLLLLA